MVLQMDLSVMEFPVMDFPVMELDGEGGSINRPACESSRSLPFNGSASYRRTLLAIRSNAKTSRYDIHNTIM